MCETFLIIKDMKEAEEIASYILQVRLPISASTSPLHQPAAPARCTSPLHQPAAPARCTSPPHQPAAPARQHTACPLAGPT